MDTAFTKLIGIEHPIVLGPMGGGLTTPDLVASVSNAGGLGGFGAHMVPPDAIRGAIDAIRSKTDKPFAVNFLLAAFSNDEGDGLAVASFLDRIRDELGLEHRDPPDGPPPFMLPAQLDVLEEMRVPVWSFALGLDEALIERGHACGATVIGTATTVAEAQALQRAGVDAVCAQGGEAGGHRSTFDVSADRSGALVGTLALVPQVVDAVRVPVLAAGGIMDGRGIVAALALGATAAQMGTRFLLASESGASDVYRQRLLEAVETDTVVTAALTGRATRSVRNRLIDAWRQEDAPEPLGYMTQFMAAADIYAAATAHGDADHIPLQAGEGLRLATKVSSATEIMEELISVAHRTLDGLRG
ncbi:MAG: nitronate monooxygenase [Actinomycetota bacterium]